MWVLAGAVWVAITVAVALEPPSLMSFDSAARQGIRDPDLVAASRVVTDAGDPAVILALALSLLGILVFWRQWARVRLVAGAFLAVALFRWGVLWLLERGRPSGWEADAFGWSYPSGHTAYSLTAALVLYLLAEPVLHKRWQRWLLLALTVAWPISVAITRVQLGVHWPVDVLAGFLLPLIVVPLIADVAGQRVPPLGLVDRR